MNASKPPFPFLYLAALLLVSNPLRAQTPEWIWHDSKGKAPDEDEVRFFRKSFTLDNTVTKAVISVAADNEAIVYVNGRRAAQNRSWQHASAANVTSALVKGENVVAIRGRNNGGPAGVILKLELTLADNRSETVITDPTWVSAERGSTGWEKPGFDASAWAKVASLGKLGVQPWGDVFVVPHATTPEKLAVLPGFKVELIRSAEPGEGSWVSMTVDSKGRLIMSPQENNPRMIRVTLSNSGQVAKVEPINLPVGSAMGLLYAFDCLYVSGNGPDGLGLYRLRDTNGDDQFDKVEFLRKFEGAAGEHGSHAVVLGPDNMLYYIHGNFVKLPADLSPNSPHRNYADDVILPRMEDGNGFGAGNKPPGGFVLRMDRDAKNCELFAAGFRNTYDIAFNADGELFGFDSDMEWDWGMPWYRPIRIVHIVSGGDYGFREGSAKWPEYYPDSLPPVVNIGIGSPTGVRFGTKSNYPEKYKRAFFAMDWSYGRILAVHPTENGATYSGTFENFVAPQGLTGNAPKATLNVTDFEFGPDGAMYFTTGGRGTQAGLYRVSYVAQAAPRSAVSPSPEGKSAAEARALRHKLEAFHGKTDPAAIDFAWPHLDSPDRWIRYAARIAIESQPVEQWQARALDESRTQASLTALLALARRGNSAAEKELLQALGRLAPDQLDEMQKLEALRVLEVALIRLGRPDEDTINGIIGAVDPLYPAKSFPLNRELCQLLVYLEAPGVVPKTLALLDSAQTQEEQICYIVALRNLKTGWTMEQRRHYFGWFNQSREGISHPLDTFKWFADVGQAYHDGASFPNFIKNIRKEAVASLSDDQRAELASVIAGPQNATKPSAVQRSFVKEWKMDDLAPALDQLSHGRNFARGKQAFNDAQCILCHRFGNEGGSVGPDLTGVSSRFNPHDILESILDPSKVISEQFQNITVTKKDGEDLTGRLVEETNDRLVIVVNPLAPDSKTVVNKKDVTKREASKVSPMPEGAANILTKEDILDLIAYLQSNGDRNAAAFAAGK